MFQKINNAHGDVVHLTDNNGNITHNYDYDPYGNQLQDSSSDTNPIRYCGEYYDTESGYVYLRARYYDSSIGRFINEDPALDGTNWYIYCYNNPIMYVDPTGLKAGDKFSTLNKAAEDFAKTTNGKSIKNDWEYRTYFYKWSESEKTSWGVFANTISFGLIPAQTKSRTYYSYTTPDTDKLNNFVTMEINPKVPKGKFVAYGHTHGKWKNPQKYVNDDFSGYDKTFSGQRGHPLYLATTNGSLRRWDPNTFINNRNSVITKKWKLPHDKNHPDLSRFHSKNCKNCY